MTISSEQSPDHARATAATYVYGVVGSGTLQAVNSDGVSGSSVEIVDGDGVAALVSDLPSRDLRVRRTDLRRHLDVIEEAFRATTILPCRFGTVVESRNDVHDELLAYRREDLLAGLAELKGRVQLNVKATYDEDLLLAAIVARDPQIARLRDATRALGEGAYAERLQLGELVAAAVADQRDTDAARILDTLARKADAVALDEPTPDGALKASFLVERSRLRKFDKSLEDVAAQEQPRLRFDVIGPLPPTAFASAVVEA